jgi:hypothetical protein
MNYHAFLETKKKNDPATGIADLPELNPILFQYQRDIVGWALKRGRAAIWADCGMGKGPMALEYANHVPGDVLIVAPLAVSHQFKFEAEKFGVDVGLAKKRDDITKRITVTNYERLDNFDLSRFHGVVLDESSILKAHDGKTRNALIEAFQKTPFRLCCTATPAPNDHMELGNHAEFLGTMSRVEMLSMFFVHDGGDTSKWRLKGHAKSEFWRWLASWAVMIRKPSDLGYDDRGFVLPDLLLHQHTVQVDEPTGDCLFAMEAQTLQERLQARRATIEDRVSKAAEIVNATDEQFLVWCNLNDESAMLAKTINGAVEVKGSDSPEHKEQAMMDFTHGKIRVLVSKPSIAGFGMNWQHCRNMAFVGLSDSYEQYYQAVRRCWRFGQKNKVNVHIITAETEGAVVSNIRRKEQDAITMAESMVEHMHEINAAAIHGSTVREKSPYVRETVNGQGWTAHLGDCVDVVSEMPENSLHFCVYSPPFSSLYTYSNSDRDMGNCTDDEEFYRHYKFMVQQLFKALMPGRLVAFHCMNLPTSKTRDGQIGIKDFRGDLIRLHQESGFIYHSEVCIWKDPVTAMQRTKALGLLHKQLKKDSCMSRQGIPDYLVVMRKPGDNPERVTHTNDDFPVSLWQRYASPVWMDINPSDTLQYRSAREHDDERHICPLQLEVIRRALKMWSNPGDLVFSPFMGIGSEGFVAIQEGRRFVGSELKRSYFEQACKNLQAATEEQKTLFG